MVEITVGIIPYFISLFLSLVVALFLFNFRKSPSINWYFNVALFQILGTLLYILELIGSSLNYKIFMDNLQFITMGGYAACLYVFSLIYTQNLTDRNVLYAKFGVAGLGIISLMSFFLNDTDLIRYNVEVVATADFTVLVYDWGWLFWIWVIIGFFVIFRSLALLYVYIYQLNEMKFKIQASFVAFAATLPIFVGIIGTAGISYHSLIDISPISFGVANVVLLFGLFRYHLFDILPVARTEIIEQLDQGIGIVNSDGVLVDYNMAFSKLLEFKQKEIKYQPIEESLSEKPALLEFYYNTDEDEEVIQLENKFLRFKQIPIAGGRFNRLGSVLVVEDITTDYLTKQQILKAIIKEKEISTTQYQQLHTIKNQLNYLSKMEGIGRLSAGIAHDFNNLLTTIKGNVELLNYSIAEDQELDINQYLEQIDKAVDSASRLTTQLLLFSKQKESIPSVVNINDIIDNMVTIMTRIIDERVNIDLQLEDNLWNIEIEISNLEQIVTNLIVNANDAMLSGGMIEIQTSNEKIEKYSTKQGENIPSGEYVCLSIADSGSGIAEDEIDKIFQPFYTSKTDNRTGLGLTVVKGVVEDIQGFIEIETQLGEGTTFKLFIPRHHGTKEEILEEETTLVTGQEHILLVEDDRGVRLTIQEICQSLGYTVMSFSNPKKALSYAKKHNDYDIVVTDIIMPEMTGLELVAKLREFTSKPVLFISGYSDIMPERDVIIENSEFISKPIDFSHFSQKLRNLLESTNR